MSARFEQVLAGLESQNVEVASAVIRRDIARPDAERVDQNALHGSGLRQLETGVPITSALLGQADIDIVEALALLTWLDLERYGCIRVCPRYARIGQEVAE